MKPFYKITALFIALAGFQSIVAMQAESMLARPERFGCITLTKPTLSASDDQLWTFVFKACKETDSARLAVVVKCLETLVQRGTNINAPYTVTFEGQSRKDFESETADYTPLVFAVASKKIPFVQALLNLGAGANVPSSMGVPLHAAAINDVRKVIPLLVAHGADINATDEWGQTALFKALYHRHEGFFEDLYKYPHLDCQLQDNQGQNPLHYAILAPCPSLSIVKKLLARGANQHVKDRLGNSALDYARSGCSPDIIALLEGRYVENKDGFLAETVIAPSQQTKLAQKAAALQKAQQSKKKKRAQKKVQKKDQETQESVEKTSPKKRSESVVEIETTSPTKKIREGLNALALERSADEMSAKRVLTFSDATTQSNEQPSEEAPQLIDAERLDRRVKEWFDNNYLARVKQASYSDEQFARSVYYHQIPLDVINCVMNHGKCEPYASKENSGDVGTKWYLRGTMVFANPYANPWLPGRREQPGYYHCTMDSKGIIYHIGFDAVRDGSIQLHALLPKELQPKIVAFPGVAQGITHQFKI